MDDVRLKKEINKLKRIFKEIPENKKKLCLGLIENAAFMAVTLMDLQEEIKSEGAIISGKNGNGFNVKMENPAQKSYNTMVQRYTATIRQLQDLLPDTKTDGINKAGESLAAFVASGKPVEVR